MWKIFATNYGITFFLYLILNLNVKSPYPIPTRETLKSKPDPLPYPKRHPKFSHLGKNLEVIIQKALKEENPEKRLGFANAIAYYMKLAYNNWHKELVHDDAIQSELTNITEGQLEFTNTPFVKAYRPQPENRGYGKQRGKFQHAAAVVVDVVMIVEIVEIVVAAEVNLKRKDTEQVC